jgi:hypothetical protein
VFTRRIRWLVLGGVLVLVLVAVIAIRSREGDDGGAPQTSTAISPTASSSRSASVASPDLGATDRQSVITTLLASGALTNEERPAVDAGIAPPRSACVDALRDFWPEGGKFAHQATTTFEGQSAEVLVFRDRDQHLRTLVVVPGTSDPEYSGCRLLLSAGE